MLFRIPFYIYKSYTENPRVLNLCAKFEKPEYFLKTGVFIPISCLKALLFNRNYWYPKMHPFPP